MKIRKDSPFYGISEEEIDVLLTRHKEGERVEDLADEWEADHQDVEVTNVAMKHFLSRAKRHRILEAAEEDRESMAEFAGENDGKVRDGVIAVARDRLMQEALEKGDSATLMELYKAANEERAREREVEVERRKAAVAEENAKIGWRRVEVLAGRATNQKLLKAEVISVRTAENESAAEVVLRLLPQLRVVLEEKGTAEEKLARVREALGMPLLLEEGASG